MKINKNYSLKMCTKTRHAWLIFAIIISVSVGILFITINGKKVLAASVSLQSSSITNGLSAEWKFDEGQGNSISDSISGSNGVFVNNPTWTSGKLGGALDFNGNSRIKVVSNDTLNNLTTMTISAWINVRTGGRILTKSDSRPARFYLASPPNSHTIHFGAGYDAPGGIYDPNIGPGSLLSVGDWQTATGTISYNTWHQVTVTYTDGNPANVPTIYIDGVVQALAATKTPAGNPMPDNSSLYFGDRGDGVNFFDGKIDEVRIYNRVLSLSEVQVLYTADNLSSRPNIIVIMTDDQDDQGTLDVMTNVKSLLLNKGVRFLNSFAENPLCCPSRATFLTGQCSHNNTVWTNGNTYDGKGGGYGTLVPTANNTLPVWLQNSDYYTGLIGKYLNGYGISVSPTNIPPGWNTWFGLVDPSTYSYYNYTVNDNGMLRTYGNTAADYQTDVLSGKAVDFINARVNSSQPFFLWLTPLAPHNGAQNINAPEPAPRYKGLFSNLPLPQLPSFNESDISDKPQFMKDHLPLMDSSFISLVTDNYRKRRETLLGVDDIVANIVNALQVAGKLDNTYIIFTSDNGYFQGEHRLSIEKYLVYEESIRVPLIIRGPGIPAGETRNQLVSNLDLSATILDLAQATAGRMQDGQSIMPFAYSSTLLGRTALFQEGMDKIAFDSTFYGFYSAIHTNHFVYVEHTLPGGAAATETELYNLSVDPYELNNKHNDLTYASAMGALQKILNTLKNCSGSSCWVTIQEPPLPITPLPGGTGGFNFSPTPPPVGTSTPYILFHPVQLSDGSWIQPASMPSDIEESYLLPVERKVMETSNYGRIQPVAFTTQGTSGGTGGFNPNPTSPQTPSSSTTPYTPFPPVQMPNGTWVQPAMAPQDQFSSVLRFGMKGMEVVYLQNFLAKDPALYPEGLITGYFGTLTKKAVVKFQEKYTSEILIPVGLQKGSGFVGQLTLKKLTELAK